ncbi:hypothetical protein [Shewanella sp. S23-S33]
MNTSKRARYSAVIKLETTQLVVEQGYTAKAMNVGILKASER